VKGGVPPTDPQRRNWHPISPKRVVLTYPSTEKRRTCMGTNYKRLLIVLAINAVLMFFITFANIWEFNHLQASLNRIYMALMMTAPMGIVMLLVMRSMYENRKLTALFIAGFVILFALSLALTRTQGLIGNEQLLRSMTPHHSSAILMCERASLTDPQIIELCEEIVRSQEEEIAEMKSILQRE
jgi:hypothetical protein